MELREHELCLLLNASRANAHCLFCVLLIFEMSFGLPRNSAFHLLTVNDEKNNDIQNPLCCGLSISLVRTK